MSTVRIGIIGGSGLYEASGLENVRTVSIDTPYGPPSDTLSIGRVAGHDAELVFLPRHGRGHRLLPSEVNYRANIWALKKLGVAWVVSVSAVGSLQEEVVPGHVVVIDQFIDRTKARASTFFGDGAVGHVAFGDPVCGALRGVLLEAARAESAVVHDGGTYVCMEGPAFSTRAESELYRSWGARVIGMTNLPEAKLAREAGLSYATLAMATDYDCWHEGHDDVTVEQVIAVLQANVALARRIVRAAVPGIVALGAVSPFDNTLASAMISEPGHMSSEQRRALALFAAQTLG
jgi:5'-methylthioadenosine phosphorylase